MHVLSSYRMVPGRTTSVNCISGGSWLLYPAYIIEGSRMSPDKISMLPSGSLIDLDENCAWAMSEKGFMTDKV